MAQNALDRINRYLWFFLYGTSHFGKVISQTTTFDWMWSVVLFVKLQDSLLINIFGKNQSIS